MEINTQKLFSPWGPEETERVVKYNLAEAKDADRYVRRMKKILPTGQFKVECFFDLKVVSTYTKKELEDYQELVQKKEENDKESVKKLLMDRRASLQKMELTVFRIALMSGVILFGCTYYFGKGNRQNTFYIASVVIPLIAYPYLKRGGHFVCSDLPEKNNEKSSITYLKRLVENAMTYTEKELEKYSWFVQTDNKEHQRALKNNINQERTAHLERVDSMIFKIALVSGIILSGCVNCFVEESHQTIFYIASIYIPSIAALSIGISFSKRERELFDPVVSFRGADIPKLENKPFKLVVYRCPMVRKLPPNFNIKEDVDIFTQELFTEKTFRSPKAIYLPHAVVDSKGFIQSVLEKGALMNPLGGKFDQKESQEIVRQISRIFWITPAEFWSCFEDRVARRENGVEERGLDADGQYTTDARAAIEYAFNGIINSALPEIDEFFDRLEGDLTPAVRSIAQSTMFQCYISLLRESMNSSGFFYFLQLMGFPPALGMNLRRREEFEDITMSISAFPFLEGIFLKNYGPNEGRAEAGTYLEKLKKIGKRAARLEILSLTSFNLDMQKKDKAEARVKRFEALTGVSLSENEDGSQR